MIRNIEPFDNRNNPIDDIENIFEESSIFINSNSGY